ncbi:hypothetical protein GCM10023185_40320 [Hymenobacter saemangeumensis]|uniref:Carboxypeptidase-like regulatory domain-containing protein n=1 Tax=Hymenobacter saemangeumensis TaxID=1084522 RepID=A0ABP8IRH6_9BACT
MKRIFLLPLFLIFAFSGFGQTIKGRITDAKSGQALPFVNIGVVGKALGTVSNEQGLFELAFPDRLANDTVRISSLGYDTRNLTLRQLSTQPQLALSPAPVALAEVQVSAKSGFRRTHTLGFTKKGDGVTLVLDSKDLGAQMGTVVYLKRKPTKILSAHFNVAHNHVGPLTFRLNLYRLDAKGRPTDQKLLTRDVVQTSAIEQGTLSFDLRADRLILDEDFFLALEWVGGGTAAKVHKGLGFSAGIGFANNNIYLREVSHDSWERLSVGAAMAGMQPKLSFYVTVQD